LISGVSIRAASAEDIVSIQQIAFATWPVAYGSIISPEQMQYMLQLFYSNESLQDQMKNGHTFLLAEIDNNCIGFASYNALNEKVFKLQKLYINPSIQKTGAGKLLLQQVKERSKNAGAKHLQLNVNRYNPAIEFYKKIGFIIMKEEDVHIGNNYFMNDYVMEILL
jgi:N-acetylglutamate synthase-like GNAT family acetyltransferase